MVRTFRRSVVVITAGQGLWSLSFALCAAVLTLWLAGCADHPFQSRTERASEIASSAGWHGSVLTTDRFQIQSFVPLQPESSTLLTVYIEGDGFAWANRHRPSRDPTPRDPIGLRLATLQSDNAAAYLARPCQFIIERDPICRVEYWTNGRYARDVVESLSQAISHLKRTFRAQELRLVGFSGGGVIAMLIAAGRSDVREVVTIASNLDVDAWVRLHEVSPLNLSEKPISFAADLRNLPQTHIVGEDDENVPPELTDSFLRQLGNPPSANMVTVEGADHDCCWTSFWRGFLAR